MNIVAPLALIQMALPTLLKTRGVIVNLTSDAAIEAYGGWGGYGSSKAALDQLSAILAVENNAVRVYAFDPGDMRTEMHQAAFPSEDISDRADPESVYPRSCDCSTPGRRPAGTGQTTWPWPEPPMTLAIPHTHFDRSPNSNATEPPEARGVARDRVRLLVAQPSGINHARFADLGDYLRPGDLLVVNNSATLPAAVDGSRSGQPITVHFSTALDDHVWAVELRPALKATGHLRDIRVGERIDLPDGAVLVVSSSYPDGSVAGSRLWTARLAIEGEAMSYLARHGRPIRYSYVPRQWPLSDYQRCSPATSAVRRWQVRRGPSAPNS